MAATAEAPPYALPHWVIEVSFVSAVVSSLVILVSILLHLKNYRRPYQQRLMIRIQLIVPLFALSCYSVLTNSKAPFNRFVLEPLREIYEAFVIYTFFSLLIDMLGGERNIIVTTSGRPPVNHPGIMKYVFPAMDISDSSSFLMLKRGILQYVWIKPFICLGTILTELIGVYNVNNMSGSSFYLWLMILYNMTVTTSLYCLAMFWMILWTDLKPFDPVGKFLCVKLIIFASYWQGVILAVLNLLHVLPGSSDSGSETSSNIGLSIQNALLCVELIFFAVGHWLSFSYKPYTMSQMPYARLQFVYAVRDMFGVKDLIQDFKLTFHGDYYKDYKTFDSVNASIAHPLSRSRMNKINQGLRYQHNGKHKHWLPLNPDTKSIAENATIGGDSIYAPSIGASTKAIAPSSPKLVAGNDSSPSSPLQPESAVFSITESLNSEEYDYDIEGLDEDEALYNLAHGVINNYKLDQGEIKKLLNYPIIENTIDSHAFGYKVKKLRQNRLSALERGRTLNRSNNNASSYGSIV